MTINSKNRENSPPSEGWIAKQDGVVNHEDYFEINGNYIQKASIIQLPFNPNLKEYIKKLRYAHNLPEVLFWDQVKKRKFHNVDFDRQRIIGNYIVDFYIKQLGLVIEIDGINHNYRGENDIKREEYLFSLGLKIFRIPAENILKTMDFVLKGLEQFIIDNYKISTTPSSLRDATPPVEGNLDTN